MKSPIIWAEIDLNAIAHNVRELRRITNPKASLMVAVKANAYGHGIIEVARQALKSGADALGVARVDEGIRLREAGIDAPVLVFGYTVPSEAARLYEFDLIQTVYSYETARALSDTASSLDIKINIHLKIDTGMGRIGIWHEETFQFLDKILNFTNIELEGILTHFPSA